MNNFNPKDYVDKDAAWLAYRRKWLKEHPPLDNGCYVCAYCGKFVPANEITLDHIENRHSGKIFDESNIAPACGRCNYLKGSRHIKPKISESEYDLLSKISSL